MCNCAKMCSSVKISHLKLSNLECHRCRTIDGSKLQSACVFDITKAKNGSIWNESANESERYDTFWTKKASKQERLKQLENESKSLNTCCTKKVEWKLNFFHFLNEEQTKAEVRHFLKEQCKRKDGHFLNKWQTKAVGWTLFDQKSSKKAKGWTMDIFWMKGQIIAEARQFLTGEQNRKVGHIFDKRITQKWKVGYLLKEWAIIQ